jgi:hypothetical protein
MRDSWYNQSSQQNVFTVSKGKNKKSVDESF